MACYWQHEWQTYGNRAAASRHSRGAQMGTPFLTSCNLVAHTFWHSIFLTSAKPTISKP